MEHKDYKLAAIMFTDIVGFSKMMEEDERGTLKTLDVHNALVREQVDKFRGQVIKTIGDAFLVMFNTALDAVQCSIAVQNHIREYTESRVGKPLTLRIGVHLGDIYFYENDALGEGINIASRLQGITKPGRITLSREVYSQVSGKLPMRVESLGQVNLKNISREVHAYEVIPEGTDNDSFQVRKERQPDKWAEVLSTPQPEDPPLPTSGPEAFLAREAPKTYQSFRELKSEWKVIGKSIKERFKADPAGFAREFFQGGGASGPQGRNGRSNRKTEDGVAEFVEKIIEAATGENQPKLNPDGTPMSAFQRYKAKFLAKDQKNGGVMPHLMSYLGVNGFLFVLNYLTGPSYWWFLWPLGGWGIGLVSHMAENYARSLTRRELVKVEDLDDAEGQTLQDYQKSRTAFITHTASNIAVTGFLFFTWAFTSGLASFMWPLIPAAAMGLGILSHFGVWIKRRSAFKTFWKNLKKTGRRSTKPLEAAPTEQNADPLVRQARELRDSILSQANSMKDGNPFGEDMTLTLDNYVTQIGELSTIDRELGQVIDSLGEEELAREEAELRAKLEKTASEALRGEYSRSLSEVEKQRKSFADLRDQREILQLRLGSALKNLRQMQIDLARIRGLNDSQPQGYLTSLKDRSQELSTYLEDYREGLKDLQG